jgi:hypothetical protein
MASLFDPHIIILITSYVKKKISAVNFSNFRYTGGVHQLVKNFRNK